jgi:hypothetical protein
MDCRKHGVFDRPADFSGIKDWRFGQQLKRGLFDNDG